MAASETLLLVIKAKDEAKNVTSKLTKDFGSLKTIAVGAGLAVAAATTAAVAGVTKIVADGVSKAADLEQRVADIASILGKSAEEAQPLSDLITNLGLDPNLKVDAGEAADAIQMLAQNGLNMTEIIDGAARATVLLANSTGGDFATAADTATDAMAMFKINASDMSQAVNGITGVTTSSKFAIGDYQLALAAAGGVASQLGVDFDDFNAVLAATASSFSGGSDAGTSFKTFLMRLVPQSNEATDAMRALGLYSGLTSEEFAKVEENIAKTEAKIAALDPTSKTYAEDLQGLTAALEIMRGSLVEGQNAFYNVDGTMKSMSEVAGILQGATAGLTEEQKNAYLTTIFGTDALRMAMGVAEAGTATIDAMKKKIGDTSAEESAKTRMDTLKGSWEIFLGQVDALSTGIGQQFLPIFREMVNNFIVYTDKYGPDIIAWFQSLAQWFAGFVQYATATWGPKIVEFLGGIMDGAKEVARVWGEQWPIVSGYLTETAGSISEDVTAILTDLGRITGWFDGEDGKGAVEQWGEFFAKLIGTLSISLQNLMEELRTIVEAVGSIGEIYNAITSKDWGRAWAAAQELAGKLGNLVTNPIGTPFEMWDRWNEGNAPGRAAGGPVMAGAPYMVGEMGPELFVPGRSGTVLDAQTTARMGTTINIENINLAGSGDDGRDVFGVVELLGALYG